MNGNRDVPDRVPAAFIYWTGNQRWFILKLINDMVAKSIGDDTNYKQLLILPFDN